MPIKNSTNNVEFFIGIISGKIGIIFIKLFMFFLHVEFFCVSFHVKIAFYYQCIIL